MARARATAKYDLLARNRTREGTEGAKRNFRSVDQVVGGLRRAIAGIGAGIAGVVGGFGLSALVSKVARIAADAREAADRLGKLSRLTGASAAELRVLRRAGEFGGVGAEAPIKALRRLARVVDRAAEGSRVESELLDRLGLAAVDLEAAGPVKSLLRAIAALRAIESDTERLALGGELLGERQAELVEALAPANLQRALEATRRTGVPSADLIAMSEEIGDSMTEVGYAVDALGESILERGGPRFLGALEHLEAAILFKAREIRELDTVEFLIRHWPRNPFGAATFAAELVSARAAGNAPRPGEPQSRRDPLLERLVTLAEAENERSKQRTDILRKMERNRSGAVLQ